MTTRKPRRRPSIHMIDVEADALAELAVSVEKRMPDVAALLSEEISRATIHEARDMPRDIVTMSSKVEFFDEANGATRSVELVYPQDADIDAGRISILTPIGAGLIGLRRGQSIRWPDRDGHERALSVVAVEQPVKTG
mgnify:CR=1 FL=1